jgi:hypothetical protein
MPRRSWRRCRRRSEEDGLAEDVAEFYVGGDEQPADRREGSATIATLADNKLTELALQQI